MPDRPPTRDGLAVLDRDGIVRVWSPAAEQLTGWPAAVAVGSPPPFPTPAPQQVIDHRLSNGRWLKISAGELPGPPAALVLTFSDATVEIQQEHDRDLLVAIASHELRTPITVVKGYADTLNDHWECMADTDRREAVRVIAPPRR